MRIAIDLLAVRSSGTIVYASNFLPALAGIADEDDEFIVFITSDVVNKIAVNLPENMKFIRVEFNNNLVRRMYWEQIIMPRFINNWGADVLFAPFDIASLLSSCRVLLAVRNPSMALLVNNTLELPVLGRLKAYLHKLISVLSCRKAYKVFYPTYYAMKLLGDLASVPVQKRRVVNHGTDYEYWFKKKNAISVLDEYRIIGNNYVLFVSNFLIYKRVPVLIDAFALLISNISNKYFKLVLVGTMPNEKIRENIYFQVRKLGLQNNVVFLENIPLYNLAVLYQEASVFVCPSVMETFGQIYVEAMASGAPVVCADTEFANELCGDAACYFKIDDMVGLADVLIKILSDQKLRTEMREKSYSRAKLFSWEREARETLSLLKEVPVNK